MYREKKNVRCIRRFHKGYDSHDRYEILRTLRLSEFEYETCIKRNERRWISR